MAEKLPGKINLEIVTPERQFFCGEVDAVTVPGIQGYLGILPGHAPLLSELKNGVITVEGDGAKQRFFCGWGFVEVLSDRVSILAEVAEASGQIDAESARKDREKAEGLFRSRPEDTDYKQALNLWEQAVARLEVVESSKD
ncbi:MAG: ATP synthase F1 subunit epsilon [Acidobacteriota bacterium]|nr:MAG: ATP synthase F1 subunit epsilon [Acidobacteriota bacterium]